MSQNFKRNIAKEVKTILYREINYCYMLSGSSRGWLLPKGWEAERGNMASGCPGACHPNETSVADPELMDKFKQQSRLPSGFAVMRQARAETRKSVQRSGSGPVGCMVELGARTYLGRPLGAETKQAPGPMVWELAPEIIWPGPLKPLSVGSLAYVQFLMRLPGN